MNSDICTKFFQGWLKWSSLEKTTREGDCLLDREKRRSASAATEKQGVGGECTIVTGTTAMEESEQGGGDGYW
jgi:hypothetical protein